MEVYLDDIMVESKRFNDHFKHLRRIFERMRHHQLKLNPFKCVFRLYVGNFLGLLLHLKGIVVDHNKSKAIIVTKAPQN